MRKEAKKWHCVGILYTGGIISFLLVSALGFPPISHPKARESPVTLFDYPQSHQDRPRSAISSDTVQEERPSRILVHKFHHFGSAMKATRALYDELGISNDYNVTSTHMQSSSSLSADAIGPKAHHNAATIRAMVQTVLRICARERNMTLAMDVLNHLKAGSVQDRYGSVLRPTQETYLTVLAACGEDAMHAIRLIREMRLTRRYRHHQSPPTRVHYTQALKACRRGRNVQAALTLLNHARNDAMYPDIFMYSTALWTCAEARDAATARQIWEQLLEDGCVPTLVTYNGLLAAHSSCWDVSGTMDIFHQLQEHCQPNHVTYRCLATVLRVVDDVGLKLYLLTEIYDTLKNVTVQSAGPILEALIVMHGAARDYDSACNIFDSIEGLIDAPTQRAMIFACSNSAPPRWEKAIYLLETYDIVDKTGNETVDPLSLSHAVVACAKANQWEEGLQLLRLHGTNKTTMHAVNSLIASCGRSGRPDMAIEVLNELQSFGLQPDAFSYRNAIIACNQAEHEIHLKDHVNSLFRWWECAVSLLRRCQEDGIRPDVQTYSSAISACQAAGHWQRALSILDRIMHDESIQPNLYCFNSAIAACEKGGAWVEAVELYERMKLAGPSLKPNPVTIGSLIQALDKSGQKELAQSIYEEALVSGMIKNPWRSTFDSTKQLVRAIDLHQFSAAMARTAIRSHIESLITEIHESEQDRLCLAGEDLVIITGKGLRSIDNKPILNPSVKAFLKEEYGLVAMLDPNNSGRLIVSKEDLSRFQRSRQWSEDDTEMQ